MRPEVLKELVRRCDILIKHSRPGEMSTGMSGSMVLFRSALCMIGYPFKNPPEWMDEEYIKPIMTKEEFHSDIYDDFVNRLFEETYKKVNKGDHDGHKGI